MADSSWASTPAVRRSMQSNRSRDTKPELLLRRALHARGFRYRVCTKPLPDLRMKADIVFRPSRVAVEVRGCFWHGCPEHHRKPSANSAYWAAKVTRNVARDERNSRALAEAGWLLIVVWEHDDVAEAVGIVANAVRRRR
ncbi:very short patch repair endonuclease [Micromonospora sp. DH14]|uniref:very short patch repair endonuclease n=1 Tax=Micromonospora sp. DH14 TaxID=3040120 RepID=UPI0024434F0D|nr:very short patch repair endonuclease [Micromonospora sp. DH14]MDG9674969.1 very short patch repair endonuclease [Micromonospora sp. DH14]